MKELKKELNNFEKLIKIGFASGFVIFFILFLANDAGFDSISIGLFMGLFIGLALPSIKIVFFKAWEHIKKLDVFVASFFDPNPNILVKLIYWAFFLYLFVWLFGIYACCSPIVTAYRYYNIRKKIADSDFDETETDNSKNNETEEAHESLLRRRAEAGDAKAMFSLGLFLAYRAAQNEYDDKDIEESSKWFKKAAENGNTEAMAQLAFLYRDPSEMYDMSFYWEEKAANLGRAMSMYNLSIHFLDGLGTPIDMEKYHYWYELAKQNGVDETKGGDDSYRKMKPRNNHIKKTMNSEFNTDANEESLLRMAEAGDTDAMRKLAMTFAANNNIEKTIEWTNKAAELGNIEAMAEMAEIYRKVEKFDKSFYWEEKAAYKGNAKAMYNLSIHFRDGLGTPVDSAKHHYWYERAIENGFSE